VRGNTRRRPSPEFVSFEYLSGKSRLASGWPAAWDVAKPGDKKARVLPLDFDDPTLQQLRNTDVTNDRFDNAGHAWKPCRKLSVANGA
jgi:hypothetical protein